MSSVDPNRFKSSIVGTLARRSANHCSNPMCQAITSGPADKPDAAINIGEAAHIYGANLKSARYRVDMSPVERSDITNAIWLCGNCHKLIDSDPARYPAELLFEWRREHEAVIEEKLGKGDMTLRRKAQARQIEEFGKLSYLAEQIIIDKPEYWEFKLTSEVLYIETRAVFERWKDLSKGLYVRTHEIIKFDESIPWLQTRLAEISQLARAFTQIANVEFAAAWGAPGEPGDERAILRVCRLFGEMCATALAWEERVRFARVEEIFADVYEQLPGVGGGFIDEAERVPAHLRQIFSGTPTPGTYELSLTLAVPPGWEEETNRRLEELVLKLKA